jgi:hypothetical protein
MEIEVMYMSYEDFTDLQEMNRCLAIIYNTFKPRTIFIDLNQSFGNESDLRINALKVEELSKVRSMN